jgi:hypothetical protein
MLALGRSTSLGVMFVAKKVGPSSAFTQVPVFACNLMGGW